MVASYIASLVVSVKVEPFKRFENSPKDSGELEEPLSAAYKYLFPYQVKAILLLLTAFVPVKKLVTSWSADKETLVSNFVAVDLLIITGLLLSKIVEPLETITVSYTHLTLPTILLV